MLHLFPDATDPWAIVPPYMDAVCSGSFLVLSHLASESDEMTRLGEAVEENETTNYSLVPRRHADVARFFDGLELVEPGLVLVDDWRPGPGEPAGDTPFHGGVAIKPWPRRDRAGSARPQQVVPGATPPPRPVAGVRGFGPRCGSPPRAQARVTSAGCAAPMPPARPRSRRPEPGRTEPDRGPGA